MALLLVFMWKNFKRMKFHWKSTIAQFLIPVAIVLLTFLLSSGINYREDYDRDYFLEDIGTDLSREQSPNGVYFAPNSNEYLKLVSEIEETVGFRTFDELYKWMESSETYLTHPAAFFDMLDSEKLRIDIRYGEADLEQMYHESLTNIGGFYSSYQSAYQLSMMNHFSRKFYEDKVPSWPTSTIQPAPMKDIDRDFAARVTPVTFALLMVFGIVVVSNSIIVFPMVEEKQDGIKELLSIATSRSYLNQLSMFLFNFVVLVIIGCILFGISAAFPMFYHMSYVHPIILFLTFLIAYISYSAFISAFFDSVTYASIGGALFYIIPYVLFLYLDYDSFLSPLRVLSPMTMFTHGFDIFDDFMRAERVFDFSHWTSAQHPNSTGYSMLYIVLSFPVISCLYLFLYFYISSVFPGHHGTPQTFYFLFTRAYWFGPKKSHGTSNGSAQSIVQIENLSKHFKKSPFCGKKFTAVDGINFNLKENRITVLLGHNGAGKTTTMAMITGTVPPSAGRIIVDGDDKVNSYRSTIGYCPQMDVFIRYMSCRDHLMFFGQLRGLSVADATSETNKILEKVKLSQSGNLPAKKLSSGMKRRLCLACAVIGQTKLVILDEPSSGLDPESRRDLWDVLLPLRKERTILLTTHSMEEADVLGDKILIMDHGKIICEGTQFQLKRQFGSGYTLKLLMRDNFKFEETLTRIKKSIPEATVKARIHPTLSISLPYAAVLQFPATLADLESNQNDLGIESLSMANTTMEEVFINSASNNADPYKNVADRDSSEILFDDISKISKWSLWKRQVLAIWYKKSIYIRRSWFSFFIQILFPVAFIGLTYYASTSQTSSSSTESYPIYDVKADYIKDLNVYLAINSTVNDRDKFIEIFERIATRDGVNAIILEERSLFQVMLENLQTDRFNYLDKTLAAIEISEDIASGFHFKLIQQRYFKLSEYYTISLMNNMIAQYFVGDTAEVTLGVGQLSQSYSDWSSIPIYAYMYPIIVPYGFTFFMLFFVGLVFMEESSEFKVIQNISPTLYWLATFCYDGLIVMMCSGLYAGMSLAFDIDDALPPGSASYLFLIFTLEGFAYVLIMYLFAKSFKKLTTIYTAIFYVMFPASMAAMPYLYSETENEYPIWPYILRFFPDFGMRYGMAKVLMEPDIFTFSKLVPLLITILIEIVLLLAILILVYEDIYVATSFKAVLSRLNPQRWICFRRHFSKNRVLQQTDHFRPDAYVETEKNSVKQIMTTSNTSNYPLLVSELSKYFGEFHAVQGVDFAVEKGQCFGLLGMNGAGKSSIFKMMTLNNSITGGQISVNGFDSRENVNQYQQQFGYCPEMSALLDFMTSYELLRYMAWIKGTPFALLDSEAKQWLKRMDLVKYENVPISDYSGGTKRKLNTALSMIGNPSLIFMDEPTTGVDPVSRRFMWSCIKDFQAKLKTIVLTSHSMDECEELCNRLAIMNVGQFKCIGVIQKLKAMFGTGFTLLIKVRENSPLQRLDQIKAEIKGVYECILRDDYAGTLVFNVIEKNIVWSTIFHKVEKFCGQFTDIVEDFAINEISLEDIFLQFKNTR